MTLHRVRFDRVEPQPWKNGGGLTRELLAWPDRQGWALRISLAEVRADGPFSPFAGVDRWFAVVDGAGVRLGLPASACVVGPDDAPLHFRGEAAPMCELLDGPTRDLNLMIRRDAGRGGMRRAAPGEAFAPRPGLRALFTADALRLRSDGAEVLDLPPLALAWSDRAQGAWSIAAEASVRAWWLHFEPVA